MIKGLELSKQYYEEFGLPMLEESFSDVKDRIAVGLVGEGSECLGYDDDVSTDHDFEPGFCLFITKEDEREFGFKLERAYSKLPKEYKGFQRPLMSPAGGNRRGVIVIDDFYNRFLGTGSFENTKSSLDDMSFWLYTEPAMLLSASNGEVWKDDLGMFSEIRNVLNSGYPEDIRIKKLAAHLSLAGQAGQYNYSRCLEHGEIGAAQLATNEFVKHLISAVYLLNNKYEPFYKWAYKGMVELTVLSEMANILTDYSQLGNDIVSATKKNNLSEDIATLIITELKNQGLSKAMCNNLSTHAISIMDSIENPMIRNMNVMEGA